MFRRGLRTGTAGWLASHGTLLLAAVLTGVVALAAPAAAQISNESAVSAYTLTPERMAASLAAVVTLIGAVIGGLALVRSTRAGADKARRRAIVSLVMGPIGLLIGGLVVVTADGGLGTGNGLAGGIVAILVGLIGTTLGALALARLRRTT